MTLTAPRSLIVADIETMAATPPRVLELLERDLRPRGNLVDPRKIQADLEQKRERIAADAALSPLSGAVAAIGVHDLSEAQPVCFLADQGEKPMLAAFVAWLEQRGEATLVTFCGRRFDLPFLGVRLAVHDLAPLQALPLLGSRRYSHHVDLKADLLDDFAGGLDLVATALLGRGKAGNGTDVAEWVRAGQWDKVSTYCMDDVELTRLIYERYRRTYL